MSKGDTRPPARSTFDDTADPAQDFDRGPRRMTYRCRANGCPMPGAIFTGGDGICAYHHGATGSDFPAITTVLRNWTCVAQEVNAARQFSNDQDRCGDVKAQTVELLAAWNRLQPVVPGWESQVRPTAGETLGDWGRRLEVFLFARIKVDVLGGSGDARDTPTVAAMRKQVRGGLHAPETGWAA